MNEDDRLLRWVVEALERSKIAYMICGSLASSLYGRARATNDVDVVIDPTTKQLDEFLRCVPEPYYVSPEAATDALARRGMFNAVDPPVGAKVDLVIRKERSFSVQELSRRRRLSFTSGTAFFASPEDVILSKLEWAGLGGSDRQLDDAAHVVRVQGSALDVDYLRRWANDLGVSKSLELVLNSMPSDTDTA